MKKLAIMLFIIITFNTSFVLADFEKPNIISKSAILMDNKTEKILYSKNANEKMYPASTTKIVTAILALENCNLDDIITVSQNATLSIPEGYSTAFLQIGEQLTVKQLVELLLIHSANDAANTLAEHVGGSIENFVSMMNSKIHELGLHNTHFTNSYGMHDENHYTTAKDLAFIMKYCMKNENFRILASKASCEIPATNKYDTRKYISTNDLIIPDNSNYYPFLIAGKTGYTAQAGDCLVSCSYKHDLELTCVILGGLAINETSTRFSETKTLYDYGYNNYSIRTLLNTNDIVTQIEIPNATKETKNLDLISKTSINVFMENSISTNDLNFKINLNENINAPIEQGAVLGNVSYMIDDLEYKTDLIASHYVAKFELFDSLKVVFFVALLTYILLKLGIGFLIVISVCIFYLIKK